MDKLYTQEALELCLNASLPKPVDVCEKCGGGFWKKIKKGSDVEKYLIFCRCSDSEDDTSKIEEKSEEDKPEDKKPSPEIPKHLRSRYKPNHFKERRWVSSIQDNE